MIRKCLLIAALCILPGTAFAQPSIIFNGVEVTGASNQRFTDVTVEFDAHGNVIITAPQYRLVDTTPQSAVKPSSIIPAQVEPASATTQALAPASVKVPIDNSIPALPADSYPTYISAVFDSPGLLGFNVDVYINGRYVKTIDQGQAQSFLDISSYLTKGQNSIQYRLIMAADSGTSHKATVELSLAKMTGKQGGAVELAGRYVPVLIKGADGAKMYSVDVINP